MGESILAQVKDMEFILDYIEKRIKIKYSDIGLVGFSTGGLATSIYQMQHDNTAAVFSMDGSQEYSLYLSLYNLKEYAVAKTKIPYFLVGNNYSQSIYPYFNSIKSKNKFFLRMPHLGHFGFVSFWTFFDNCNPDTIDHNYSISYQFICESAFTFFDATLNKNKKSHKELLSLHSHNNDYVVNEKIDFSESLLLLNIFLEENIESAIEQYKDHKIINFKGYNYNESEISALGRMLLDYDIDASIKLFLFNKEEYPDSWHAYYDLAYSYKIKGEIYSAKKTLLKALEKNPENKELMGLLEELD